MCKLDHSKFPYDTQACPLHFQAEHVSLNLDVLSVTANPFIAQLAFENQWHFGDFLSIDVLSPRTGEILFKTVTLKLQRKSLLFVVSLVLPMVLTSYMNTLVFLLPPQSGEKVSYLVTTFVSTSVFTTFINNAIPRGVDSLPTMMKLLIGVIAGGLIMLMATLIVLSRFHQEQARGQESKFCRTVVSERGAIREDGSTNSDLVVLNKSSVSKADQNTP